MRISVDTLALNRRDACIGIIYLLLYLMGQWLIAQAFCWPFLSDDPNDLGLRFGFVYLLFGLLISGSRLLFIYSASTQEIASRWGCKSLEQINEPACHVAQAVLDELWQLRTGAKPSLFLIPCHEINAFSFNMDPQHPAIYISRGCLNYLSRTMLKVVLIRQLQHLNSLSLRLHIAITVFTSSFCSLFISGQNLLQLANFGRFEKRAEKKEGSPIYFLGLIPLFLGLPSWLLTKLFFCLFDKKEAFSLDQSCLNSLEAKEHLLAIFQLIKKHPHDDTPSSLLLFRGLWLHNEGFLESFFSMQPSLEERESRLRLINNFS